MQTGLEMAAEAKEAGVDVVTLVHSKDFVTNSPEQGKIPLQRLKKIGVDVMLGTRAEHVEGNTYSVNGDDRAYDVVFNCVGFHPLHGPLVKTLGDVLTPTGALDVNASFQVCNARGNECTHCAPANMPFHPWPATLPGLCLILLIPAHTSQPQARLPRSCSIKQV